VAEAQERLDTSRIDYNENRPHSPLWNMTPEEYARLEDRRLERAQPEASLCLTG
jgi:transposase InsO family protein